MKFKIHPIVEEKIKDYITNNHKYKSEEWLTRYFYILNKLRYNTLVQDSGSIHINNTSKLLKTENFQLIKFMNWLLDSEIIKLQSEYLVGSHSRQYSLLPLYLLNTKTVEVQSNKVTQSIINNKHQQNMTIEFHNTYFNNLKNISININLSISNILSSYDYGFDKKTVIAMDIIEDIKDNNWYLVQPVANSRLYHNLCNLSRKYRKDLNWSGEKIIQADVTASQVFIGLALYLQETQGDVSNQDIVNLIEVVKQGSFYELMMSETGYTGDRNEFKTKFFESVYFCKETSMNRTIIGKAFKKLFPTMYQFIMDYKVKNGYNQFAISCQILETKIIEDVLTQLYSTKTPAINLHDAVLFPESVDGNKVLDCFVNSYDKLVGIVPNIKISQF